VAQDQPFASYWFPNTLLSWTPGSDRDAPYNRSHTALRARFYNPATQVNPHARPYEGTINNLAAFAPTSNNPSQGTLDVNYYDFSFWQYVESLVFWGGSAGEGLILAPNPGIIDAGHRNGVKVLGNIFFPPTQYGGQIQWVRDLVQKNGQDFPVADKLIEVAQYYGFEGWFINQETSGGDAALAAAIRDFMIYLQGHSDLEIEWYDAMIENGQISWQSQLNNSNDMFFQYGSTRVSDRMFLDFGWNANDLAISRTNARNLGRSEYELYAGANVESNGYNSYVNWGAVFPEGQPHVTSLGFYRPDWTYNHSSGLTDFYTRESRFWVGANRDPSNTNTTSAWKGLAHYIPDLSPIDRTPFITNFCTGQGYGFYIDGRLSSPADWSGVGWNNLSLQDVLPSWRWIIQSGGIPLTPDFDWTDAYYGGNCLKVSGALSADNHLKLFNTLLPVSPQDSLEIAYKTGSVGPTHMEAGLAFQSNPSQFQYLDVGNAPSAGWNLKTFDLSPFAGDTIAAISLYFTGGAGPGYQMKIGRIGVRAGSVESPSPPSGLYVENKVEEIPGQKATLRLRWDHAPGEVYEYNVYRRNPDDTLTYLGGTANNAYFVQSVERVGDEESVTVEVEAVSPEFGRSEHATTTFLWSTTAVEDGTAAGIRRNLTLESRPNPFHGGTTIDYSLPRPGEATLTILDVTGRSLRSLEAPGRAAGRHSLIWDGTDAAGRTLPSGLYLIRITAGGEEKTARVLLLE
jgi:mannosyl-glycoprotein endo-beta-N-acetylglucosaminidase